MTACPKSILTLQLSLPINTTGSGGLDQKQKDQNKTEGVLRARATAYSAAIFVHITICCSVTELLFLTPQRWFLS